MSPVRARAEHAVYSPDRIKRETFLRQSEFHQTIASTNARAMELAARGDMQTPLLVLAEHQTAGKGRGANVWWSAPGAVTFSIVLDLAARDRGTESWPSYALAAAVGVCEALEGVAPGTAFGIRWPNDVCHERRKICGILPELGMGRAPHLVLGVGVNVNNSLDTAPDALKQTAAALVDLTGHDCDLTDFVIAVLKRLEVRFADLASGDPALPEAWAARCQLRGNTVRLRIDNEEYEGVCEGIDASGALRLGTGTGARRFYGGTIAKIT